MADSARLGIDLGIQGEARGRARRQIQVDVLLRAHPHDWTSGAGRSLIHAVPSRDGPIIVFDALCVLCSANTRFILGHDRKKRFRLASMQDAVGAALYGAHGIDPDAPETLIILHGERVLRDSDAVLAIYAECRWPWRATTALRLAPRAWRDPAYRWIARNRYRLFGRRETCWLPSPEDRDRLL